MIDHDAEIQNLTRLAAQTVIARHEHANAIYKLRAEVERIVIAQAKIEARYDEWEQRTTELARATDIHLRADIDDMDDCVEELEHRVEQLERLLGQIERRLKLKRIKRENPSAESSQVGDQPLNPRR
jgi:hypothetical protein